MLRSGFILLIAVLYAGPLLTATAKTGLEVVAEVDEGPGNITVTPDGRLIISLHQFFAPEWRVAEILHEKRLLPFPDERWNLPSTKRIGLDSVLGIQSDQRGVVWMLDNGMRSNLTPKLVGWDTRSSRLEKIIYLPHPITSDTAFVNDLAIDEKHQHIYIADPARGEQAALIVVDLKTGLARRVLEGQISVVAEDVDLVIDGVPVEIRREDGTTFRPRVGVNPIALDAKSEWLYYGPMHGTALYRIATRDLVDVGIDAKDLPARVQRYSDKPICDGISIDIAGNIYISDIGNNAIGVIDPNRKYRVLVSDERLSWPDAFSFGPDGRLYTVANQLHKTAALNAGDMQATPPYLVLRIIPLANGITGR